MKKITINKILTAILFSSLLLSACKKQLVVVPRQSIDSEGALNTKDEINASITTMYALFKNPRLYGRDLIAIPEALADNGYATNKSGRLLPEYQNQQPVATNGANHFTSGLWSNAYSAINQINLTLTAIPTVTDIPAPTAAEVASWQGQLFFLRGMYYFQLMNAYAYMPGATAPGQDRGGVPVNAVGFKTSEAANAYKPKRETIDSVYNYIIADLLRAETNLNVNALQKSLATKAAARAMLSRVYLYAKKYTEAKLWSDNTITTVGASQMTDQSDYVSNWRSAENKETIFQIRFTLNSENIGVNESLQTSFTTLTAPGLVLITGGFGDLVPTITLLTDLGITLSTGTSPTGFTGTAAAITTRSSDVRNLLYEPGTSGRGKAYVECTKYLGKNGFINLDNVPVIRLSEIYLTRAEAQVTPGSPVFNVAAALADLKFIKSRRYVAYTGSALETADNALTPTQLFDEIIRQRRIELAFEGHRFFDFKRRGVTILKSPPLAVNLAFTDPRVLAPIPQGDVDPNPNLQQNFGY